MVNGKMERTYPRLAHGGEHLQDDSQWLPDVFGRLAIGLVIGVAVTCLVAFGIALAVSRTHGTALADALRGVLRNETELPWRAVVATVFAICVVFGPLFVLAQHYHVFGTDRTGNDVFYQAMKSIRTAFVIGTLSTIATLPLAVGLGILSGYLRGWVDEVVQYLYTTLSSIPNVLLIAACVLMMQVFIDTHPDLFETGAERADVRLFLLCVILGLTGWATLCRLLRAETMKLSQLEYVQAATAFGVPSLRIMVRHIFPNVVHLIIITTVLDFSALILYEAVLSYVGVGVDPSMNSFGGMINLARTEMSRDPLVWWSFAAAFGFMVTLVLAANLFADGVRDAFDPRARSFRPRLRKSVVA
jgi:peptide/nickel transport system permease protein